MHDKQGKMLSWKEFSNELATFDEQPCNGSHFTQLTNLKQLKSIIKYIVEHIRLEI